MRRELTKAEKAKQKKELVKLEKALQRDIDETVKLARARIAVSYPEYTIDEYKYPKKAHDRTAKYGGVTLVIRNKDGDEYVAGIAIHRKDVCYQNSYRTYETRCAESFELSSNHYRDYRFYDNHKFRYRIRKSTGTMNIEKATERLVDLLISGVGRVWLTRCDDEADAQGEKDEDQLLHRLGYWKPGYGHNIAKANGYDVELKRTKRGDKFILKFDSIDVETAEEILKTLKDEGVIEPLEKGND